MVMPGDNVTCTFELLCPGAPPPPPPPPMCASAARRHRSPLPAAALLRLLPPCSRHGARPAVCHPRGRPHRGRRRRGGDHRVTAAERCPPPPQREAAPRLGSMTARLGRPARLCLTRGAALRAAPRLARSSSAAPPPGPPLRAPASHGPPSIPQPIPPELPFRPVCGGAPSAPPRARRPLLFEVRLPALPHRVTTLGAPAAAAAAACSARGESGGESGVSVVGADWQTGWVSNRKDPRPQGQGHVGGA